MFTLLPYPSHVMPVTIAPDMTTISQMGPTIVEGPKKLRVLSQIPPDGSAPPRANIVRDRVTQRVANNWHFLGPQHGTRHPQALYLSPHQEVSFTPLDVGCNITGWVFPIGITRESRLKPPGHDLPVGGGGNSPCLVLWTGSFPCWLSLMNSDPASTQILIQHYGSKSQTVSQLTNLRTAPTRQVPVVHPV
jgi:hypothetical protein